MSSAMLCRILQKRKKEKKVCRATKHTLQVGNVDNLAPIKYIVTTNIDESNILKKCLIDCIRKRYRR